MTSVPSDKATSSISSNYVAPSTYDVRATVSAERWETDITTGRFMAVINDAKQMVAAL